MDADAEDPFIAVYDAGDLAIAAEFLTNWLPFLTRGLCPSCSSTLRRRILSLHPPSPPASRALSPDPVPTDPAADPRDAGPRGFEQIEPSGWDTQPDPNPSPPPDRTPTPPESRKVRMSWADMVQEEDELEEEEEEEDAVRENRRSPVMPESSVGEGGTKEVENKKKTELTRDQREQIRFRNVKRKTDFICLERVNGKFTNVLSGLELHTGIFSAAEQKRIVDFVYELQEKGRKRELGEHTYSEPRKWMRGKGRVTIQFGCCYNYATVNGVPPGIMKNVLADPLPPLFKVIIRRLVRWHVLPPSCVPDSCIVNIYEPGDCIPPHIDSHDFVRPFTTVSFLSECNILFGSNLKILGPGEFTGSAAIPLPVGSVLVLNGNGADVAKHCVPAVPTKRISITFRKMDESKLPFNFSPEPDLQNILPLPCDPGAIVSQNHTSEVESQSEQHVSKIKNSKKGKKYRGRSSMVKPGLDFHHSQHPPFDPHTPAQSAPHRIVDPWTPMSTKSMDRGRESVGRWFEQKPIQPELLGTSPHQVTTDVLADRSPREGSFDKESFSSDRSREQSGRIVQLEQKRMVVRRNMEGEEDSFQKRSVNEDSSSMQGNKEYSGRRVMLDQKRIVISRNLAGEEEPMKLAGRISEPAHISRVSLRSLNNGRRRTRLSLSDDG